MQSVKANARTIIPFFIASVSSSGLLSAVYSSFRIPGLKLLLETTASELDFIYSASELDFIYPVIRLFPAGSARRVPHCSLFQTATGFPSI